MQFWHLVEIDRKVGRQQFIFIDFVSKQFISRRNSHFFMCVNTCCTVTCADPTRVVVVLGLLPFRWRHRRLLLLDGPVMDHADAEQVRRSGACRHGCATSEPHSPAIEAHAEHDLPRCSAASRRLIAFSAIPPSPSTFPACNYRLHACAARRCG